MADLAEGLRGAAGQIELDQADLARMLETNPRTVSRWLSKQTAPIPSRATPRAANVGQQANQSVSPRLHPRPKRVVGPLRRAA